MKRILHNEELHNLYSSPSIIRIIKSRRIKWAGHVAGKKVKTNAWMALVGKPEREHSENEDRLIILKGILER
jgi:hypothetical protein